MVTIGGSPEGSKPRRATSLSPSNTSTSSASDADAKTKEAEAKRARRSEIERRSRQRRQGGVQRMRGQLEALERDYQALTGITSSSASSSQDEADDRTVEELRVRYLSLAREAKALREQQAQLQRMLSAKQLTSDSIKALTGEFVSDPPGAVELRWGPARHASIPTLQSDECFALIRRSFEAIAKFDSGSEFATTGSSMFGWSDKRRLADGEGKMFFSFTKKFPHRSCEQLLEETWRTYSDQEFMRRVIFPPRVHADLRRIQVVSDDAVVFHRHTTYLALGKSFHTVYLLFRLRIENGYVVCFRTIPAPGLQRAMEPHEAWIDLFHW